MTDAESCAMKLVPHSNKHMHSADIPDVNTPVQLKVEPSDARQHDTTTVADGSHDVTYNYIESIIQEVSPVSSGQHEAFPFFSYNTSVDEVISISYNYDQQNDESQNRNMTDSNDVNTEEDDLLRNLLSMHTNVFSEICGSAHGLEAVQNVGPKHNSDVSHLAASKLRHVKTKRQHECGKTFYWYGDLVQHIHVNDKPFVCYLCGQKFSQSGTLVQHIRSHLEDKRYVCPVCNKKFGRSNSLVKHKRTHSGDKPYICRICTKAFSDSSHLSRHTRIHSGTKPYACHLCEKAFTDSSDLNRHKRIHSGDKPYICPVCYKAFNQSGALAQHKRIHSGAKPYKCDQCNKGFSQSSTLIQHKLVHSNEKPYVCTVCDRAFNQSSTLIQHRRTHSHEKPYLGNVL